MGRDIHQAVREACLWLPEAEERQSHGAPTFFVRGKTFAMYAVNHHGDGRVALWLNMPAGAQELHTRAEPQHYFVPPYVGPRGWLGVRLDQGISWQRVAALVRTAYEKVAPQRLAATIGRTVEIEPPPRLAASELDPLQSRPAQAVLRRLRRICLALPEATEAVAFGSPVWRAGRKTFAGAFHGDGRLQLTFWVGAEKQSWLGDDPRYRIPAYMGHNGWIALDVSGPCDWDEIRSLAHDSYRHFALRRMLAQLAPG